jgi:hypothetical protein
MTPESLLSLKAQLLTSQMQLKELLPSVASEQLSTLGTGGVTSMMELIDTLMQWYDTLSPKQREKFWTLSLDFLMLGIAPGTPSRELSS